MGRILYDEFSKMEMVSSGKSIEQLTKERWGQGVEVYATCVDHSRDVVIVWYHSARHGEPIASTRTAKDLKDYGLPLP